MAMINFFKSPRHRQFNYEPLYYNERKEQLDQRVKEIEAEMSRKKDKPYSSLLRRGMKKGYFSELKRAKKKSNIRLIIILLFLVLISYLLLY